MNPKAIVLPLLFAFAALPQTGRDSALVPAAWPVPAETVAPRGDPPSQQQAQPPRRPLEFDDAAPVPRQEPAAAGETTAAAPTEHEAEAAGSDASRGSRVWRRLSARLRASRWADPLPLE